MKMYVSVTKFKHSLRHFTEWIYLNFPEGKNNMKIFHSSIKIYTHSCCVYTHSCCVVVPVSGSNVLQSEHVKRQFLAMIFNPFSTYSGRLQKSLSMTEEKQTSNFRALPSVLLAL